MRVGFRDAVIFAVALAAGAAANAQDVSCPHTRASPVRAWVQVIGGMPCGGGSISFGGAEVKMGEVGCPIAIVAHPPYHEEVDAGGSNTRTETRAMLSPKIAFFECVRHDFLLIPIGSTCELKRIVDGAAFADLMTVGCPTPPQGG